MAYYEPMKPGNDTDVPRYTGARPELLPFLPKGAKSVLDVGCATGSFGAELRNRGLTVWGVEPEESAARVAAGRLDGVVAAPFDAAAAARLPKGFDCIFFNDVLEHLVDPGAALRLAKTLLNPAGDVVACIPNVLQYGNIKRIVLEQDWKYEEFGIMDRTHLRFFTRKSMERLFREEGYSIRQITGLASPRSITFRVVNLLLLGWFESMGHAQYVVVATPRSAV